MWLWDYPAPADVEGCSRREWVGRVAAVETGPGQVAFAGDPRIQDSSHPPHPPRGFDELLYCTVQRNACCCSSRASRCQSAALDQHVAQHSTQTSTQTSTAALLGLESHPTFDPRARQKERTPVSQSSSGVARRLRFLKAATASLFCGIGHRRRGLHLHHNVFFTLHTSHPHPHLTPHFTSLHNSHHIVTSPSPIFFLLSPAAAHNLAAAELAQYPPNKRIILLHKVPTLASTRTRPAVSPIRHRVTRCTRPPPTHLLPPTLPTPSNCNHFKHTAASQQDRTLRLRPNLFTLFAPAQLFLILLTSIDTLSFSTARLELKPHHHLGPPC
ncbi:hypothetical protein L207DRAFT_293400 [Hyaloscypha variabilis F]|uniref:Uncharacterized protein n=1 Tax=Hyaloscypha variabilis (strain UAMH 11265 / GT02V1 / F) TaxID=1149755 RepID=A0A2J6RXT6_HYAVF|nr:hypothetical protein L207DRAFT_293400 [Hyaloscypha variabilis F]